MGHNLNVVLMLTHPYLAIIWLHFLGDFVLQSDMMAKEKSTSCKWLTIHILHYALPFLLVFGWKYTLINSLAHWVVDYFTSRMTSKAWAEKKVHKFFVIIGFDQAIHMTTLLLTTVFL